MLGIDPAARQAIDAPMAARSKVLLIGDSANALARLGDWLAADAAAVRRHGPAWAPSEPPIKEMRQ